MHNNADSLKKTHRCVQDGKARFEGENVRKFTWGKKVLWYLYQRSMLYITAQNIRISIVEENPAERSNL